MIRALFVSRPDRAVSLPAPVPLGGPSSTLAQLPSAPLAPPQAGLFQTMRRASNGRALRRLAARPAPGPAPPPAAASRGYASRATIAPLASALGRRAASHSGSLWSSARAARALAPSSLLPACASALATRAASTFLTEYDAHVAERAASGIAPKPLDAKQVAALCEQLESPPAGDEAVLMDLFENRVPPGVDEAAYVKASWLAAIVAGDVASPLVDAKRAVAILGTMQGGYNIEPLVTALDAPELADIAADALSKTLLMFDAFHDVEAKARGGNEFAQRVMRRGRTPSGSWRAPRCPRRSRSRCSRSPGRRTRTT